MAPVPRADDADRAQCDTVVVLDTAKPSRAHATKGWDIFGSGKTTINVDHHATNTLFATVNWVEGRASSTSELVYRLLAADGKKLQPAIASALYAGILGDTAGFSLPNTTAPALEAAAALVRAGADVRTLGEKLDRSQRESDFHLLRTIYRNTQIVGGGRIAYSQASYQEIAEAGCTAADIDDQIAVPRALDGIDIAILFTEGNAGKVRVNFRGERGLAILEFAQKFGGGGHREAAGAMIRGNLDDVVKRVLNQAIQYLDAQPHKAN